MSAPTEDSRASDLEARVRKLDEFARKLEAQNAMQQRHIVSLQDQILMACEVMELLQSNSNKMFALIAAVSAALTVGSFTCYLLIR